jgi:hypothetical protein
LQHTSQNGNKRRITMASPSRRDVVKALAAAPVLLTQLDVAAGAAEFADNVGTSSQQPAAPADRFDFILAARISPRRAIAFWSSKDTKSSEEVARRKKSYFRASKRTSVRVAIRSS